MSELPHKTVRPLPEWTNPAPARRPSDPARRTRVRIQPDMCDWPLHLLSADRRLLLLALVQGLDRRVPRVPRKDDGNGHTEPRTTSFFASAKLATNTPPHHHQPR